MSRVLSALPLAVVLLGWVLSLLSGYDVVTDLDVSRASEGPSAAHWLGTDRMGRDVAWRLLTGSEAFVGPALLAGGVASVLGIFGGAIAGFIGGPVAVLIRYLFTVVASIPRFVLVLLACAILGNSIWLIGLAAGLAYTPTIGEAVFSRVESFRQSGFVTAARAHGVHPARILGVHILWVNCRRLVVRHLLAIFAFLLLLETTLSYIGNFGVAEPAPSWGNMLALEWGQRDANLWASLAPALAIYLVTLSAVRTANALSEGGR